METVTLWTVLTLFNGPLLPRRSGGGSLSALIQDVTSIRVYQRIHEVTDGRFGLFISLISMSDATDSFIHSEGLSPMILVAFLKRVQRTARSSERRDLS